MPAIIGGEPSDEAALWEYGAADRGAVASGGVAGAAGAGKSVQSQEGDGGVSDKTGWEGRHQQLGARIGIVWTLSRALGPAKENNYALESQKGYIVWGCWELKRKFRVDTEFRVHDWIGIS